MVYLVSCTACDLEDEIETLEDVLNRQESHEAKFGSDHFVEFELLDDD